MNYWVQRGKDPTLRSQNIEIINTKSAKRTIVGWLIGLAYYNWFASDPLSLPLWAHAVLVVGGVAFSCLVIGGGMALLAALVTKLVTGKAEGSIHGFGIALLVAPVLAFFAAKYALLFAASLSA